MTCTKAEFDKRTAEHQLEILRDDGLYRHLRCRKPGTGIDGFDLVTWPGFLCYCGDMGEYVFQRCDDMLAFFRRGLDLEPPLEYWAERCVAQDRDGIKEYCSDKARQVITEWLDDRDATGSLRQEVEDEILCLVDDGEHVLRNAIEPFEYLGPDGEKDGPGRGWRFEDFYEADLTVWTYRFRFCCYALTWAVQRYDAMKGTS